MVTESQLTSFAKSSKFVQQYALGNRLISSDMPEIDIVFTSQMIVLIDTLLRKENQSFTLEELSAGIGLEEENIEKTLDELMEKGIVTMENKSYSINSSNETVKLLKYEHPRVD